MMESYDDNMILIEVEDNSLNKNIKNINTTKKYIFILSISVCILSCIFININTFNIAYGEYLVPFDFIFFIIYISIYYTKPNYKKILCLSFYIIFFLLEISLHIASYIYSKNNINDSLNKTFNRNYTKEHLIEDKKILTISFIIYCISFSLNGLFILFFF